MNFPDLLDFPISFPSYLLCFITLYFVYILILVHGPSPRTFLQSSRALLRTFMNCLCCWDCSAIDWWPMETMQKANPGAGTVSAHKTRRTCSC